MSATATPGRLRCWVGPHEAPRMSRITERPGAAMPTVGDVDVAPEEQDVGKDRKPGQEQRQQPERRPEAVHPAGQAQIEWEGLPEDHEQSPGYHRPRPDIMQALARV